MIEGVSIMPTHAEENTITHDILVKGRLAEGYKSIRLFVVMDLPSEALQDFPYIESATSLLSMRRGLKERQEVFLTASELLKHWLLHIQPWGLSLGELNRMP